MTQKITNEDLMLLNGFLDQELSQEELVHLASILVEKPELNQAIKDLAETRKQIRSLPIKKGSKNFTLTPEMAGVNKKANILERLLPAFKTVAAFCAILLSFTFIYPKINQTQSQSNSFATSEPVLQERSLNLESSEMSGENNSASSDVPVSNYTMKVINDSDLEMDTGTSNADYRQSAQGVRGGNPRNEYLLSTEWVTSNGKDFEGKIASPNKTSSKAETDNVDLTANKEINPQFAAWKKIIQYVSLSVLFFSLGWITAALISNKKTDSRNVF